MSKYTPKSLDIIETPNGYELHDKFGLFDGPYATLRDAVAVRDSELESK